jgi:hypothetical protein
MIPTAHFLAPDDEGEERDAKGPPQPAADHEGESEQTEWPPHPETEDHEYR